MTEDPQRIEKRFGLHLTEGLAAVDPVQVAGRRTQQPHDELPVPDDIKGLLHDCPT